MNRVSLSTVLLLAAMAFAPVPGAEAQVADQPSVAVSAPRPDALSARQAGISRAVLAEHARQVEAVPAAGSTAVTQARSRRGTTLMIVGGAAFLAGLIIGDDAGTAIAVGGAAIGLYGLYLWAQ